MKLCPITYEDCGNEKYSKKGLYFLAKNLEHLQDFPFTPKEQVELSIQYASKISIQGVQPKLSVRLNVSKEQFEIVERDGLYIFKPPHHIYEELPENEDLTMRLARMIGLEVPLHGMIYNIDGSLTYFIKRFDRLSRGHKIGVEDFSQIMGFSRETKYESSMEKIIPVIEKHCTFPVLEKIKFFRMALFNFLVGNEDMHLKNFSLIRREGKIEFSPCYDLVNSSIVMKKPMEEIALPICGKKSKLSRDDFFMYFGKERLGLNEQVLGREQSQLQKIYPAWKSLIQKSFLSEKFRNSYLQLLRERFLRLFPTKGEST